MPVISHWTQTQLTEPFLCLRTTGGWSGWRTSLPGLVSWCSVLLQGHLCHNDPPVHIQQPPIQGFAVVFLGSHSTQCPCVKKSEVPSGRNTIWVSMETEPLLLFGYVVDMDPPPHPPTHTYPPQHSPQPITHHHRTPHHTHTHPPPPRALHHNILHIPLISTT